MIGRLLKDADDDEEVADGAELDESLVRSALTERQVAILVRILCRSIHHYCPVESEDGGGGKAKSPKKKGKKGGKKGAADDEDVLENLSVHLLKVNSTLLPRVPRAARRVHHHHIPTRSHHPHPPLYSPPRDCPSCSRSSRLTTAASAYCSTSRATFNPTSSPISATRPTSRSSFPCSRRCTLIRPARRV